MHSVLETPTFSRQADELSEDDRNDLIETLAANPLAGDVIVGTGGIRKLRWAPAGRGKRGAYRVIFYTYDADHPVMALLLYGKNQQSDLTDTQRKALAGLVQELKRAWSPR